MSVIDDDRELLRGMTAEKYMTLSVEQRCKWLGQLVRVYEGTGNSAAYATIAYRRLIALERQLAEPNGAVEAWLEPEEVAPIYVTREGGEVQIEHDVLTADCSDGETYPAHQVSGALTWRDAAALARLLQCRDAPDVSARDVVVAAAGAEEWTLLDVQSYLDMDPT